MKATNHGSPTISCIVVYVVPPSPRYAVWRVEDVFVHFALTGGERVVDDVLCVSLSSIQQQRQALMARARISMEHYACGLTTRTLY